MPEYIDRENYCIDICLCNEKKCDKERCSIHTAPTTDVVEVVRCRNCKHGQYAYLNGQKMATGVTCEYDQDRIKPFNHFCGNGERKDR